MSGLVQQIRVGQKWKDRDHRMGDRVLVVRSLDATYAYLSHQKYAGIRTRVRVENLRRRWELIS